MLKALAQKKIRELLAGRAYVVLAILLILSSFAVFASKAPDFGLASAWLAPLMIIGGLLGPSCAIAAFSGDYVKGAHRFLEFLPITRSAMWLVGYLTGIALLVLSAVLLFGTGVLIYRPTFPELEYFLPGRFELVVSGAAALFWMFSISVFSTASLEVRHESATTVNASGMVLLPVFLPASAGAFLGGVLMVFPSAMELAPVLLVSGLLYSASSYSLFALMPRHSRDVIRSVCGTGLFLACTLALLGHLYFGYLTWRELDASEELAIYSVERLGIDSQPDLFLADVRSYRSGRHYVSIDVVQGAYHDLGRQLIFVGVANNESGLLHFLKGDYVSRRREQRLIAMGADGSHQQSVSIEVEQRYFSKESLQWLRNPTRWVYPAFSSETKQTHLCIADSTGRVLKRYEIRSDNPQFLVSPSNRILALAPAPQRTESSASHRERSLVEEAPYLLIDVDADTVFRFGLPGTPVAFARDLHRVICGFGRIQDGRLYQSYVLVQLPSLDQRSVLPEEEFPPSEITSPVDQDTRMTPVIKTYNQSPTSFLRVNDRFDTAYWVKSRVEGEHFRYSIVMIDLDTGGRQIIVAESEIPKLPVVASGPRVDASPVLLHRTTTDGDGLVFAVGQQIHVYDRVERQSTVIADQSILLDPGSVASDGRFQLAFSPSGKQILRYGSIFEQSIDDGSRPSLKESVVDVFRKGRPARVFRGQDPVMGAVWLDEERIVFHDGHAVHAANISSNAAQRIFPAANEKGDILLFLEK